MLHQKVQKTKASDILQPSEVPQKQKQNLLSLFATMIRHTSTARINSQVPRYRFLVFCLVSIMNHTNVQLCPFYQVMTDASIIGYLGPIFCTVIKTFGHQILEMPVSITGRPVVEQNCSHI